MNETSPGYPAKQPVRRCRSAGLRRSALRIAGSALLALSVVAWAAVANAEPQASRARFELGEVQGALAVQRLDGWLLYGNGKKNAIASELVNPAKPRHAWYYFIPARGEPIAIVRDSDAAAFADVPGTVVTFSGARGLSDALAKTLAGSKRVAMEYAPKSGIPSLTRVDAATVNRIETLGIAIESSAGLVQLTKSLWGAKGRVAHYVAAHHLEKLVQDALAFVAQKIAAGERVTEHDVQQRLLSGYAIRGIAGAPPMVAAGPNTAKPDYMPTKQRSRAIAEGDLLMIDLWARAEAAERPIVAELAWMAYVGSEVPAPYQERFAAVAQAREAVLTLLRERAARRRPVQGFEADRAARASLAELADAFLHRTGHSLDTSAAGDGANLDDYDTKDTRTLVTGSGFTVGPGIYVPGEYGLRSEVDVFLAPGRVEVTTPVQTSIQPILPPAGS